MTKINFQKLTPESGSNIEVYDKAFEFVFNNDDVRNIAITGSYGSGKSSLIKSYEKINGTTFTTISLTHFKDSDISNLKDNEKYAMDDVIEEKIVNQLIQQLEPSTIRKSIFKVKTDYSKSITFSLSITFVLCIFGIIIYSNKNVSNIFRFIALFIFLFSLLVIIYWLIEIQDNHNILKKININGNGVELENNNISFFDKYIDEIIYLLEKNKYDNIALEDIDRFNDVNIFEQLREINRLANLRLNKNNRTIRFFYLIRGDLLEEKEMSKFFDFEIPIIPVVSNSNSFNKLKEWIENEENTLNLKFLRNICLYIDDMRLLKSIYNDYIIYKNRLSNDIHLDENKLFAMMVYKNIFPKDFSELQFERGLVRDLFENKTSYIEAKITEIEKESKYNQINKVDIEHEKDKAKNVSLSKILTEKGWGIYTKENFDKPKYNYIKNSYYYDLLKYLLKEGKIDENYSDYISYFYSNDITNTDKKFLRSLTDSVSLDFNYSLKNPELVLEYLDESDFDKLEIANLDLIKYVSKANIKYFEKAIKRVKREDDILFLVKFLQLNDLDNETIIPLIISIWPACCYEALRDKSLFSKEEQKQFIFTILSFAESSAIEELNIDDKLKNYLENTEQLYSCLSEEDFNLDRIAMNITELNIEVNRIDFSDCTEKIAKYIYENHLYAMNFDNINSAYKKYYRRKKDLQDFSEIYAQDTPLKEYINSNINIVINVLKDNLQFNDDEEVILQILNHDELREECAELYIKKAKRKINKIKEVKTSLWKTLIKNGKVKYSSDNIVDYFKQFGFDELVSKFINSGKSIIELDSNLDENVRNNMLDQLLVNKTISIEKTDEFFKSLNIGNRKLRSTNIDEEKVKILIKYSILSVNIENLIFLRNNYSKDVIYFYIENNISAYNNLINQGYANIDELKFVLNSRTISLEDRIETIKKMGLKLSVVDNRFDEQVNKFIIKNYDLYLEEKDKNELVINYSNYEKYSPEIIEMATNSIANILQKAIPIDKDLRTILLNSSILETNKKILLKQSIESDDLETVKKNLLIMGYDELAKIFEKKRKINIKKSMDAEELLELLKKSKFIDDFEINDNKYKVSKNKKLFQ